MNYIPNLYFPSVTGKSFGFDLLDHSDDFSFACSPGWDGKDSPRLTDSLISTIRELFQRLGAPTPSDIYPGKDGSLSFVWESGAQYIYCDIGPDDIFHLYYNINNQKFEQVSKLQDEIIIDKFKYAIGALNLILHLQTHTTMADEPICMFSASNIAIAA